MRAEKLSQKNAEPEFPYVPIDYYFEFPDPEESDNGTVCYNGNLSPGMLRSAYLQGIFPWYNKDEPVIWWSPNPRFVLFPENLHVPSRLARVIKQNEKKAALNDPSAFTYTADTCFEQVIRNCSQTPRRGQMGTWIGEDVIQAYCEFHELGFAHSFETWQNGKLAGGFYGVLMGSIFFGESMFTRVPEAAKTAFIRFVTAFNQSGGKLIDSQIYTDNIARFGGKNISRSSFLYYEEQFVHKPLLHNVIRVFRQGSLD